MGIYVKHFHLENDSSIHTKGKYIQIFFRNFLLLGKGQQASYKARHLFMDSTDSICRKAKKFESTPFSKTHLLATAVVFVADRKNMWLWSGRITASRISFHVLNSSNREIGLAHKATTCCHLTVTKSEELSLRDEKHGGRIPYSPWFPPRIHFPNPGCLAIEPIHTAP